MQQRMEEWQDICMPENINIVKRGSSISNIPKDECVQYVVALVLLSTFLPWPPIQSHSYTPNRCFQSQPTSHQKGSIMWSHFVAPFYCVLTVVDHSVMLNCLGMLHICKQQHSSIGCTSVKVTFLRILIIGVITDALA